MDRLSGITPKTLSQRLRELEDTGIVTADREPGRREVWYRLTPAGADLGPVIDALHWWGLGYPWRRAPPRRPPAGPLALPPRRRGLPGRKRRPPLVTHRGNPARTGRRHDHRDHPGPDRPHLRRVRRRHRHHRRKQASPKIPTADQHHGHRRTSRLDPVFAHGVRCGLGG